MIYLIAKTLGLSIKEAGEHTELDFWQIVGFGNLDERRDEWKRKNK